MNTSSDTKKTVDRIIVLGGGSAGFIAAITLRTRLPEIPVTLIRSPDIGIIGVGESSTPGVPIHLHIHLKLDIADFFRKAEPLWKLGIRFLWGKRPYFDYAFGHQLDSQFQILPKGTAYYCSEGPFDYVGIMSGLMTHNAIWLRQPNGQPLIHGDFAYHIENVHFVRYLEGVAARLGVVVKDDNVVEVLQDDDGVAGLRLASGPVETADLYIDCSGFASLLLGKTLKEPYLSAVPSYTMPPRTLGPDEYFVLDGNERVAGLTGCEKSYASILFHYASEGMEAVPVGPWMSNARNEGPRCLEPAGT